MGRKGYGAKHHTFAVAQCTVCNGWILPSIIYLITRSVEAKPLTVATCSAWEWNTEIGLGRLCVQVFQSSWHHATWSKFGYVMDYGKKKLKNQTWKKNIYNFFFFRKIKFFFTLGSQCYGLWEKKVDKIFFFFSEKLNVFSHSGANVGS